MSEKKDHVVVGIHVQDRAQHSVGVQQILTEFGCSIKTRIGLHEVSNDFCSPNGVILIEFVGESAKCDEFVTKLGGIEGVDAKTMVFGHD